MGGDFCSFFGVLSFLECDGWRSRLLQLISRSLSGVNLSKEIVIDILSRGYVCSPFDMAFRRAIDCLVSCALKYLVWPCNLDVP